MWKKFNTLILLLLTFVLSPPPPLSLSPPLPLSLSSLSPHSSSLFLHVLPLPFTNSFGVVLWELLTGKRPYDGLNLFVVAYGVGHGTLNLPIPDGCPEPLNALLTGEYLNCCHRNRNCGNPNLHTCIHVFMFSIIHCVSCAYQRGVAGRGTKFTSHLKIHIFLR